MPPQNKHSRTPASRRLWGWFVYALGLLWLVCGAAGILQAQPLGWLYLFCGIVLARMGYNLTRSGQPEQNAAEPDIETDQLEMDQKV